jgi:Bacterial Ig-like domain (group 3)
VVSVAFAKRDIEGALHVSADGLRLGFARACSGAGWRTLWLATLGALLFLSAFSAGASATTLKWSGGAALMSRGWGNPSNWEGGSAPSPSEPVSLEFPVLPSPGCISSPPTDTCYESENDLTGLDVESLHVEDSEEYVIAGEPITLGNGGLSAAPASNTSEPIGSVLALPMTLGSSQTWSIAGQSSDTAIDGNQLLVAGGVSGRSASLHVAVSDGGGLDIANDNEIGPLSIEGENPGRAGVLNGVVSLFDTNLNGSDLEPISLSHIFVVGTGATGPLGTQAAELALVPGGPNEPERLEVASAKFDPASLLTYDIAGTGSKPGVDYPQLVSPGTIELAGVELNVLAADSCKLLPPGQTFTLIETKGEISGTFGNAGEGQEVPIKYGKTCSLGSQTLRIEYHRSGVTKTVTGQVIAGIGSTTALQVSPQVTQVNGQVTLTATVQVTGGAPDGTVEFDEGGGPIPGCENRAISNTGDGYQAICQTSFTSPGQTFHVSASFVPGFEVDIQGSTSAVAEVQVERVTSATTIEGPATATVGQSVTYTAVVSSSYHGAGAPSGTVQFTDNGTPMASCSSQQVLASAVSSSAICQVSYAAPGVHNVTAAYSGNATFDPSSSAPGTLTVQAANEGLAPSQLTPPSAIEPGQAIIDGTTIQVRAGAIALAKLACRGASVCSGELTISTREASVKRRAARHPRIVKIGAAKFSIAANATVAVEVRLNVAGRALLRRGHGRVRADMTLKQEAWSDEAKRVVLISARPRGGKVRH